MEKIINKYFDGEIVEIKENTTGIINNTFVITINENGELKKYTLQRINDNVFADPYLIMDNIVSVTDYCRDYLLKTGGDVERGTLSVIRTKDGNVLHKTEDGEYYRVYNYVLNARTYDKALTSEMFGNVGVGFGHFDRMLDGYPIENLKETIPNFHNSKVRYENFCKDVDADKFGKVKEVLEEISFIMARHYYFNTIVDKLDNNELPYRVTHNDTKMNNVLIDDTTCKAICAIDLDTVMPGYVGYDFGDAIRFGAAKTSEDDPNLDNVGIDLDYYEKFTEGFLSETGDILTKTEIDYLAFSCILITLELGMRFLNDYINGSVYFKCKYPEHNLVRARNQIRLVEEMEKKLFEDARDSY